MNIHCLLLVKDEADVLESTITSALTWAHAVYVLDNGSADGSWELVRRLAAGDHRVVPFEQTDVPFTDGLRGRVASAFESAVHSGDWWCRLDADELHVEDPRPTLARVPPTSDTVEGSMFKYYFSTADADAYRADPLGWPVRPIRARLRHYRNDWAETRFRRPVRGGRWGDDGWPVGPPRVHRVRLAIRHYQYRSPDQISRRLAQRRATGAFSHEDRPWPIFPYQPTPDEPWLERVADPALLDVEVDGEPLVARPDLLPPLPRRGVRRIVWRRPR